MAWKLKDTIPPEPASVTDLIDGDLDEVTKLDVSNRDLRRLPDDLWRLHNLWALDVSNNALQILPSRIGDLTRLNRLTLNNNPLRTLPAALKQLSALNVLSLVGAPIDARHSLLRLTDKDKEEVRETMVQSVTKVCLAAGGSLALAA